MKIVVGYLSSLEIGLYYDVYRGFIFLLLNKMGDYTMCVLYLLN